MDIIEFELREHIMSKNLPTIIETTIDQFLMYNSNVSDFLPNCVYLFNYSDIPEPNNIPDKANIICYEVPEDFNITKYSGINILCFNSSLKLHKLLNIIIQVFNKYKIFYEKLEDFLQDKVSLQEIMDYTTEIIGFPMCMMDMNHEIISISKQVENIKQDKFLSAMLDGYGYRHYDTIAESNAKLIDVQKKGSIECVSNISGKYIKVSSINCGLKTAHFIGLHKDDDQPFERAVTQLFERFVQLLSQKFYKDSSIKVNRGKIYEQFLLDIIEERVTDASYINSYMIKLGIPIHSKYKLGILFFKNNLFRTGFHLKMMDELEAMFENSKCILIDNTIVLIFAQDLHHDIVKKQDGKLKFFLRFNNAVCAMSSEFNSLLDIPKVYEQSKFILKIIREDMSAAQNTIYHYSDYAVKHVMKIISDKFPLHTYYHPMFIRIISYDREKNTNYLETFIAYLRNNCSISETSKVLYMHRNSLQYRIRKIEELLDIDFKDKKLRLDLLFSSFCLEYVKQNILLE